MSATMPTAISEEPLTLISATPSPFARMNRITLLLKGIPFTLKNEIPWHSTTETPLHNPLEKLPILLFPDGRKPVYDSAHIQDYLVAKYAHLAPRLVTGDVDKDLEIKQLVVLSEGCLDAIVVLRFERRRSEAQQSQPWLARQDRKVDGAMRAFQALVKSRKEEGKEYLVGEELSIADIAVVCCLGFIDFANLREGWKGEYPELGEWWVKMEDREGFRETRPVMFQLTEQVV